MGKIRILGIGIGKETIADLNKFLEMAVSMREKYGLGCDYYMLFVEHNYFIYRILDEKKWADLFCLW